MPWRGIPLFRLAGAKRPLEVHPDVARKRCLENECHRLPGHGILDYAFDDWILAKTRYLYGRVAARNFVYSIAMKRSTWRDLSSSNKG